ncbi:alpha/beta-hydrolase [Polyplosphaeria fusca]|uniref:Alpha/beta-hydrolase n=1 Tax=Polyplosphaeria fusca TaxID=682080 RepID=A0A9P4QSN1_9PLEO|nr:alpha/beta-hydrolase [Polyplosphaeria fusca]
MSSPTRLLPHPTLHCTLLGQPSQTTTQYRNLKYATIPARFTDSLPNSTLHPLQNGIYNASRFGPSCPQKLGAQAWDLALIGPATLPTSPGQAATEVFDELNCLHVTVTVPHPGPTSKKLPVLVWIHGGGLSMGSTSWPQYDLSALVARAAAIGKPVVGVAINYRLGNLGFLASREVGSGGNFGFKDVALGLEWVKRHIGGFGGDEGDVTAMGESAGGIVLSTLLCAEVEGLFERVVVMSGEVSLRKPRGGRWMEEGYREQVRFLGLEGEGRGERVGRLREMDAMEMCQRLPLAQHFCAHVDGVWLKEDVPLGMLGDGRRSVHKRAWCKEFVVGDAAHDGTILKGRILDSPKALETLHSLCKTLLTQQEGDKLLTAYKLKSPTSQQEKARGLLHLASELRFYLPALVVHKGWMSSSPPKRAHRYHYHVPNPHTQNFAGLATHESDVAFLLQNWNHLLSEEQRAVAEQMADQWIGFVNGEGWADDGKAVVFTETGLKQVSEERYDEMYRQGRGKVLLDIGADKLWRLAEAWQGVRADEVDKITAKL